MNRLRLRIAAAAMVLVTIETPRPARAQTPGASPSPQESTTTTGVAKPTSTATEPPTAPPTFSGTIPVPSKPVRAGLPQRHSGKRLAWDPSFNRMDTPEMVVTGVSAGLALAAAIAPPLQTGWKGGILFDDAARKALRLPGFKARLDARDASDVGLALISSFPVLVDSMMVAYWYRGSDEVALQMTLIDAEAIAVASALQGAATFFGGRERPYGQNCGGEIKDQSIDCQTPSRYRSFFSGHSTVSFTSAALICAHHESLDLFENAADPITCAAGFVAASAISTLRVVGDMHYLSDVLTGALIGTGVGLGIPLLHHYHKWGFGTSASLQMRLVPAPDGVHVVGVF